MKTKNGRLIRLRPDQIVILSYLIVILVGSLLLYIPNFSYGKTSYLDALWTATSATCVTGLVVVDTGTHFNFFGQLVTLLLIQIGGLGYMVIMTSVALLLGRKISLFDRVTLSESLNLYTIKGIIKLVKLIAIFVIINELVGALLLSIRFIPLFGWSKGIWKSIYHSISAFNNAGFDLMGNFNSLINFRGDLLVNVVIILLIVMGGLGFYAISEIITLKKFKLFSLHTKIIIRTTIFLIIIGTLLILFLEFNNPLTLKELTLSEKLIASIFQSVTPRTAGFSTLNIGYLTPATSVIIIALMFIGASPGGTGGGIKTSTFIVGLALLWSTIKGYDKTTLMHKSLPSINAKKAVTIIFLGFLIVYISTFLLLLTNPFDTLDALFEVTSAFGTVGLSRGITTSLNSFGKIVLIFTMFFGRVGPATLLLSMVLPSEPWKISYPEERVIVG